VNVTVCKRIDARRSDAPKAWAARLTATALWMGLWSSTSLAQTEPWRVHGDPFPPPPASTADSSSFSYGGGPLLANVQIVAVFWGPNVDSTVTSRIGGFYSAFTAPSNIGWLCEYDTTPRRIGGGSFVGNYVITPTVNTGTQINDTDIQDELAAQINAGVLPSPNANTLYIVHFPPGAVISGNQIGMSCVDFCAYHDAATRTLSGSTQTFFYAVLPDFSSGGCAPGPPGCALTAPGCCGDRSVFDTLTKSAAHEISEAITDPDPPSGWSSPIGGEIGDRCNFSTIGDSTYYSFTSGGVTYTAQVEWSRARSACVPGGACQPQLMLTPYGSNQGYTLDLYATLLPSTNGFGPVGAAPLGFQDGSYAWVADVGSSSLYLFADRPSIAPVPAFAFRTAPYGSDGLGGMASLTLSDGPHAYLAEPTAGRVVEIAPLSGAVVRAVSGTLPGANALVPYPEGGQGPCPTSTDGGMAGSPHCGHLFVGGGPLDNAIYELDPATPPPNNSALFAAPPSVQGLAWNAAGSILYAVSQTSANGPGTVLAFDAQGNLLAGSPIPSFGAGLEGVAVGVGSVDGCLYVSDQGGNLWEVMLAGSTKCSLNVPTTVQITAIATGGSRGNLLAADPSVTSGGSFASLLVTQTDRIYRLGAPGGGFFGAPTSSETPIDVARAVFAPALGGGSLAAAALGLLAAGAVGAGRGRRRRRSDSIVASVSNARA
jgi:hypothetical protein